MIETRDAALDQLTRTLVERFAPERIVLFGSRARGDHHPESDYDLMLVLDDRSPHSEDVIGRAVREFHMNVEVFVDRRERFERRRSDVGTFEYVADHEGRVLYESGAASEPRQVRETPNVPPESLQEWTGRAQSDFTAMEVMVRNSPEVRDGIVFHAHQGVEKLLKAVLVARHVPPPRTHDLTELLPRLPSELQGDPRLAEACGGLQALWPNSRYPSKPVPTGPQVEQAVFWARRVREIVSNVIA